LLFTLGDKDATGLKAALLSTKEFQAALEKKVGSQGCRLESQGNVVLVLIPLSGENVNEEEILQQAKMLVSSKQSPLVIVLYEGAEPLAPSQHNDSQLGLVFTSQYVDGFEVVSTFSDAAFSVSRMIETDADEAAKPGSKGQPSVQSRGQFAYLWGLAEERERDLVVSVDSGKERVLQRLADHAITAPPSSSSSSSSSAGAERKYTTGEWDKIVMECLAAGLDDFGVYNAVREHTLGHSLQQDLQVQVSAAATGAAPAPAGNEGGGGGGGSDGRADFMVNMTLQCVPGRDQRSIRTVLDYGCAEGAITAELGRKLGLSADHVLGADVRSIPSAGFTFVPLSAEDSARPPALREILPSVADGSVDLITSAMVFHHVTHVPDTLLELRRIISPHGVLVLREHHCPHSEMAAFLDIMHGLYSLSWSQPVEWPRFIAEYRAWYRTQAEWDELVLAAGFIKLPKPTAAIQGHYDAATHSKKRHDGRYTNLIRAYYAVYLPDPAFSLDLPPLPPSEPAPVPAPEEARQKRRLEDAEGSSDVKRGRDGDLQQQSQSQSQALPVYESKSFRQQFYILTSDGKPVWVKLLQRGSDVPAAHPASHDVLELLVPDSGKRFAVSKITYAPPP
jgi:SAM-dependent methyltransferase